VAEASGSLLVLGDGEHKVPGVQHSASHDLVPVRLPDVGHFSSKLEAQRLKVRISIPDPQLLDLKMPFRSSKLQTKDP